MLPVDPALQQTFADNVWLHFFQMGHSSSTSARPTILVRGEGSRVWDQDGNSFIDALAGLFCVNAGYGRREIVEAVAAQMMDIAYVSPFSLPSIPQIRLAGALAMYRSRTATAATTARRARSAAASAPTKSSD